MEKTKRNGRALKLVALTIVTVLLIASLSGCLSSCNLGLGGEYLTDAMDEMLVSMLSGDAMSINILLNDPDALELQDETATLPTPELDKATWEESKRSAKSLCEYLLQFDYSSLSAAQKCDYDTLMNYFYTLSRYADYYYYQDSYLGSGNGWNVSLPIYLDKYAFRDKHDIANWISLAEQTYTVFPKYVEFERSRVSAGFGRADYVYDGIAEQCRSMTDTSETGGVHFLITLFNEKIDAVTFLTEEEKTAYKTQAVAAINGKLIPAYTGVATEIVTLKSSSNNQGGLVGYGESGKAYYRLLFEDSSSTSDSVETAYANLSLAYNDGLTRARAIYAELAANGVDSNQVSIALASLEANADLSKTAIEGYYSTLKAAYSADFPALPASVPGATFKEVDPVMAKFYNPASYFKSAIDSADAEETIFINEGGAGGYVGFDIISHEGLPGHQLQHAYYKTSGGHPLRTVLGYVGYAEGWATHAQYYSAKYYDGDSNDKNVYKLLLLNDEISMYLITLMDIDVNYYGLTREELISAYSTYGFSSAGISNVYEYVVENPTAYASYGYGYYKMAALRKSYSGDDLAFHTAVLNVGPTTYELLAKYL